MRRWPGHQQRRLAGRQRVLQRGPDHFDGFQSDGGNNITLRHNTLRNPCDQTSNILLSSNTSHISNVTIDNNLLAGGGYSLYCAGMKVRSSVDHIVAVNNRFARTYFPRGGYWGPTAYCEYADTLTGNVWDDTGQTASGSGSGGSTGSGSTGSGSTGSGSTGSGPSAPSTKASGATYLLSKPRANRVARAALKRELGRRYTRRTKGMRLKCHRSARSTIACRVKWKSRLARRYSGTVTVERVAVDSWRYSLRIRHWSSGCDCNVLIKRKRTV